MPVKRIDRMPGMQWMVSQSLRLWKTSLQTGIGCGDGKQNKAEISKPMNHIFRKQPPSPLSSSLLKCINRSHERGERKG